jgi:predicted DCC family thiol-disulfide oxidoreductase YuxK
MTLLDRLLQRWRDYWFRPAPLLDLGVCRILIVGSALLALNSYVPPHSVRELSELPDSLYDALPILHLLILPFGWKARPSLEVIEAVRLLTFALGGLALAGFMTRVTLAGFALGNLFLFAFKYSFRELHHPEAIMAIALCILALSPAGGALSVDDLRRRAASAFARRQFRPFHLGDESSVFARWPLLVIQWLFALVYLSAALSKLMASGLEWMNGDTLQYYVLRDAMRWEMGIGLWIARHHGVMVVLSWVTMLFEATFFLVPIVPRLAWVYVPLGVFLHIGMLTTMNANFMIYLALYTVFIPWTALFHRLARHRARLKPRPRPEILFDEHCPLCIRSMTVLRYADWLDRLTMSELGTRWPAIAARYPHLSRQDCEREMHVVLPDGSVVRGFFAFRALLPHLMPLWLLLPAFYFPLADRIGPRIYRLVASRRARFAACPDATCQLAAAPEPEKAPR